MLSNLNNAKKQIAFGATWTYKKSKWMPCCKKMSHHNHANRFEEK
jgi:hypothetical protein